jgi:hypothetical protein
MSRLRDGTGTELTRFQKTVPGDGEGLDGRATRAHLCYGVRREGKSNRRLG